MGIDHDVALTVPCASELTPPALILLNHFEESP